MAKDNNVSGWNSIFRIQNAAKLEYSTLQARLLAILAKADGKVLDIENFTAEAVLEGASKQTYDRLKKQYADTLNSEDDFFLSDEEITLLRNLAVSEKQKLIKYLSAVAICDGVLHKKEQEYLDKIIKVLDLESKIPNT